MKPNRRLALRRENLTELTREDLAQAAAGAPETWYCSLRVIDCLSVQPRCSWSCPV